MIRHIRKSGYKLDRRYRMGGIHHRVSRGGTLCGGPELPDDFDRANAKATIEHAAIYRARGMTGHVLETAAELCPACVAAMQERKR